jgi:hypothetical protein
MCVLSIFLVADRTISQISMIHERRGTAPLLPHHTHTLKKTEASVQIPFPHCKGCFLKASNTAAKFIKKMCTLPQTQHKLKHLHCVLYNFIILIRKKLGKLQPSVRNRIPTCSRFVNRVGKDLKVLILYDLLVHSMPHSILQ